MQSEITTVEEAFTYTGRDIKNLPIVDHLPEEDRQHEIADYQWKVILAALNKEANEGKKYWPNWFNGKEWKYAPWVEIAASKEQPAGFGFSGTDYDVTLAVTAVGSRLSCINAEITQYAQKQFPDIAKLVYLG